jgi:putative two-component system response regulator
MDQSPLILVAVHDIVSRKILEGLLGNSGYRLLLAEDGVKAIEAVNAYNPDLVLLDITMPKMNGLEVLKRIKEEEGTRLIPVVMVTASSQRDERIRAIELGSDDFLSKPIDDLELQVRMRSLLRFKTYLDEIIRYRSQMENQVESLMKEMSSSLVAIAKVSSCIRSIDDSRDLMKTFATR